jgi:RNA polymerase sigma factor (TIGR02999 family)
MDQAFDNSYDASSDATKLLMEISSGKEEAFNELLLLVYGQLRHLAAAKLAGERAGHTLQATALVHEAYIRLVGRESKQWKNSRHFFCAAADAMRKILIDSARRKMRSKRGGGTQRIDLDAVQFAVDATPETLMVVDEAIRAFSVQDPRKAELVRLRYFAGLSLRDAAESLGISVTTAGRHWAYARAWLYRFIVRERNVS